MASTYSTNLGTNLIGTGDQAGTWGTSTNFNLGTLMEQAITSYCTQVMNDADLTLFITNGADAGSNTTPGTIYNTGTAASPVSARNMFIELTGTLTASRNLTVPSNRKLYFIYNNTSGGFPVVVKTSGYSGVSVLPGVKMLLVCNGTSIIEAISIGVRNNSNTAIGTGTLIANTTGSANVAIGPNALNANTTGYYNTAVGYGTLTANTTAHRCVAIGFNALNANTTGTFNTATGDYALAANTTGYENVATGHQALYANTTGIFNTAVGSSTLSNNTTASNNTASGFGALNANTTGGNNTATGSTTLNANTSGANNTATGYTALAANTTGAYNVAVGSSSLFYNTTGNSNLAIGYGALGSNTTASNNVAIGHNALTFNTGANNTALGYTALTFNTTGTNNTCIGYSAHSSSATVNNEITLGNSSVTALRCQVTSITALSDARDKTNINPLPSVLNFVDKLRPVEFDWNMRDGGKIGVHDVGFIAQELQQAQQDSGFTVPNLVYNENPEKLEAAYGTLLPILVKAIQELKVELEAVKTELAAIKKA